MSLKKGEGVLLKSFYEVLCKHLLFNYCGSEICAYAFIIWGMYHLKNWRCVKDIQALQYEKHIYHYSYTVLVIS